MISTLDLARGIHAEATQAFDQMAEAADSLADTDTLALCRSRIATLLRAPASMMDDEAGPERIAALPSWPSSPLFSDAERACLAFTEQFVIDVAGITKAHADAVLEYMSPDRFFGFVNALWVYDQGLRLQITLERFLAKQRADG